MIRHWKALDLEITDGEYQFVSLIGHTQVKQHDLKPQTLKHVEIIKFSDNHTCDISFERT